jgi:hypothetical protein
MADEFGLLRANAIAQDYVVAALGGRTANQAIEGGLDPKEAWHAVCDEFGVPETRR